MAKSQVALKEDGKLAKPTNDLERMMMEDAGQGLSSRPEDNIVPQLKILQPMSPEVLDGPEKVEGAKPGDFLLGSSVVSGKEGVLFQPCYLDHKLFEFTPLERGGGFVAEHPIKKDSLGRPIFDSYGNPELPKGAIMVDRYKYEFANGNQLVHYRQLAGLAWESARAGEGYIIPFKSTGHTVMRNWMTTANRANLIQKRWVEKSADGSTELERVEYLRRPLFSHLYRITTSHQRNSKGQWYALEVGEPICLDPKVNENVFNLVADPAMTYAMGRALHAAFLSGEKESVRPDSVVDDVSRVAGDDAPF